MSVFRLILLKRSYMQAQQPVYQARKEGIDSVNEVIFIPFLFHDCICCFLLFSLYSCIRYKPRVTWLDVVQCSESNQSFLNCQNVDLGVFPDFKIAKIFLFWPFQRVQNANFNFCKQQAQSSSIVKFRSSKIS